MSFGISQKERDLVIERLGTMSPDSVLSVGGGVSLSRDELIARMRDVNDEVGNMYVRMDMEFLRALKGGSFTKEIISAGI